jgi:hypothetical protein
LKVAGVTFSAAEAVACVVLVGDFLEWSSDAPDPSGVILRSDGRVDVPQRPAGTQARVETYARLLHRLLPEAAAISPAGVPGALRLAVARGLGVLDAPPFATPREFRTAIARFLTHGPEELILTVLVRWAEAMGSMPDERPPERRVSGPRVDVLRRMLREADLERFVLLNERVSHGDAVAISTVRRSAEQKVADPIDSPPATWPRLDEHRFRDTPAASAPLFATPERTRGTGRLFIASAAALVALLIWLGVVAQRSPDAQRVITDSAVVPAQEQPQPAAAPEATRPPQATAETLSDSQATVEDLSDQRQRPTSAARLDASPDAVVTPAATTGTSASNSDVPPRPTPIPPKVEPTTTDAQPVQDDSSAGNGFQLANVVDGTHRAENVSLSPDGTRVAFDSDREGVRGVYIAARDGTGVKRIGGPTLTVGPAWAPDSRRLAVLRAEEDMPQVRNLWLLNLESGAERRLTQYRYGDISPASWFPDGRRLCYAQGDRLYVMDTESGASRSYDSPMAARPIRAVAASPDGRHIVFQVQDDGAWLLNLHDASIRRVLEDPTVERLAWSPSGRSVAYYSERAGHWGVWVMRPDTR